LIHDGGKSLLFWTSTSISALSRFFFAPWWPPFLASSAPSEP
jgi:hypothetical protein